MFVSESTLLLGTKLQIMSAEGHIWEAQLEPNVTILQIKQMAVEKFLLSPSSTANSSRSADEYRRKLSTFTVYLE